jgi:hypothetical protein
MVSFKEQFNNWRSLHSWRPYFLIFAIGFLLYSQTLFFDFTYFDDNELILNKAAILQNVKNIGTVFSTDAFFSGDKFYYRPLLNLSFMVDAQFGGELPFFYHLDNILLHILSAILVFCLLKKISKKPALSFFLSLIFLVHPVSTQAVAWLPGRNDSLLAIFVLAAFIFFLNFLHKPKLGYYLGYLLFLLCSLLTKETAILLPILVIFYFWFIDKGELNKTDRLLLIFGSGAAGFVWFLMRAFALGGEPINYFSAILGIIKNSSAILLDIGKIIFPVNLSVLPILQDSNLIYGIIIFVLLALAWIFSKKKRINYSIFGLAWFLLFLLPSFIRLNTLPDFLEHRLYVPLIGFLIVLMEIDWIKNLDFTKKRVKIVSAIILIIFSALTWQHSQKFSNRLIFWQTAVNNSPHSPLAERNLGAMYYLDGKSDQAIVYYNRALELSPDEAMVHNNIGLIYMEEKLYKQAEEEFKKELSLYPTYDKALFNLGLLYYNTGRKEEAGELWRQTLVVNPDYYEAYVHLLNLQNQLR